MTDRRSLRGVRWIGGGSGAGKTTIAARLASETHSRLYDSDAAMAGHARLLDPAEAPRLHEFLAMSMDERWLSRSPTAMLDSFHWFAGEGFDLVVDDVASLAVEGGVLAEGLRLVPRRVAPLLTDRHAAVWLLPTPEFRRMALERRGSLWTIADGTSDPPRALENLLERDRLFTDRLRAEVADLGLRSIDVDVGDTEDDVHALVADHFSAARSGS